MMHKKGNFKKGLYYPINSEKYIGKNIPEYRSSYELAFFKWCDNNKNVLEWCSESIIVPYISPIDNKVHRYFVDNAIVLNENGKRVKYLIEIKPYKQTIPPKHSNRKKESTLLHEAQTYAVNKKKWEAATKWGKERGYIFTILTEKHLFNNK